MLLSRLLTRPDELSQFATNYQRQAHGISIQPDYLQRAQVRVFYQLFRPTAYVAGFVINDGAPYRYFSAPGDAAKNKVLSTNNIQESDLVEIGAIWFSRYKSMFRAVDRTQFYIQMMYDAWLTNRPVILGGSFIDQLQGQQQLVLPTTVYQNVITIGNFTGTLKLYVGQRSGMWARLVRALSIDLKHRYKKQSATHTR